MLNYTKARKCWEAVNLADLQPAIQSLRCDFYKKAVQYAVLRAQWQVSSREQRLDLDLLRTTAHNAFIDACNILSRNMAASGKDISWRGELGYDRKVIGDFACYVHCFLGIEAR